MKRETCQRRWRIGPQAALGAAAMLSLAAVGCTRASNTNQVPTVEAAASTQPTLGKNVNDPNPGPGLQLDPNPTKVTPIHRTPAQWHKVLSDFQFYILRQKGTEPPHHNPYDQLWKKGVYACAGCGLDLFSSKAKYHAGTGWPSFYEPIKKGRVKLVPNGWGGTEVVCARCGGHLGDLFHDGPPPTGLRFCMDSAALRFKPAKGEGK